MYDTIEDKVERFSVKEFIDSFSWSEFSNVAEQSASITYLLKKKLELVPKLLRFHLKAIL